MMEEILKITTAPLNFSPNDKIFQTFDEDSGKPIREPYSYNDWIIQIKNISGISEEFLGK